MYSVKTEVFEGPLDVLLGLIEKRKLFINDISLAKVADDYIAHIRTHDEMPIGDTAQFVLIASTLILIKSKSLLPGIELTEEEEQSIEELEDRLKLRKQYKELGLGMKKIFGRSIMFHSLFRKDSIIIFTPDTRTTSAELLARVKQALASIPQVEALPKTIVKKVISLEETIMALTDRITRSFKINFREFASNGEKKENKVSVIVSFLALLELVKQGIVAVRQDTAFQDIEMESTIVGVPHL